MEFFTEAFRAGAICVPLEALKAVVVEGNVVFKTEIFKIVDVLVHRGRFGGKIAAEQRVFDETQHLTLSAVVFAQREVVGDESGVGVRRQHVLPVAEIGNVKLPEHRADRVVVLVYVAGDHVHVAESAPLSHVILNAAGKRIHLLHARGAAVGFHDVAALDGSSLAVAEKVFPYLPRKRIVVAAVGGVYLRSYAVFAAHVKHALVNVVEVKVRVPLPLARAARHRNSLGMQRKLLHYAQLLRGKVVEIVQIEVAVFYLLGGFDRLAKQLQLVGGIDVSTLRKVAVRLVQHAHVVSLAFYPFGQFAFQQRLRRYTAILHHADDVVHVADEPRRFRPAHKAGQLVLVVLNDARKRHYARLLGQVCKLGKHFVGKAAEGTHPDVEASAQFLQQSALRLHRRPVRHYYGVRDVQIAFVDVVQHAHNVCRRVLHAVAFVYCYHFCSLTALYHTAHRLASPICPLRGGVNGLYHLAKRLLCGIMI